MYDGGVISVSSIPKYSHAWSGRVNLFYKKFDMKTSFDLERFKAGEPAYNSSGTAFYYVETLPDGKVLTKHKYGANEWGGSAMELTGGLMSALKMDEPEEWTLVSKDEYQMKELVLSGVFKSKEEALKKAKQYLTIPDTYEAVRIKRD